MEKVLQGMAAAFIHYFLGVGIAYLFGYTGVEALIIGLIGAVQDLDFVSFFFYKRIMKTRFSNLLMHRGITHTVLFAVVVPLLVLYINPGFSLLIFSNFMLHIFTDYVTAWGVSPFQPFSPKRYSLGLMTIFDIPLTLLSFLVGASGFFLVNPVWFFALYFGYIGLRYILKQHLPYKNVVPMGNITYAFCFPEDDYKVGKIDIFGREKTMIVPRSDPDIDPALVEKIDAIIETSMASHFLEYPTYHEEDTSIVVKDARSFLFSGSSRFGFTVHFDTETEKLYVLMGGRKVELQ